MGICLQTRLFKIELLLENVLQRTLFTMYNKGPHITLLTEKNQVGKNRHWEEKNVDIHCNFYIFRVWKNTHLFANTR